MTKPDDNDWMSLSGNVVVSVGIASKPRRTRFLMLGPCKPGQTYRPTLCAGDWNGEHATIDHGVATPARLAELELELRKRDERRAR